MGFNFLKILLVLIESITCILVLGVIYSNIFPLFTNRINGNFLSKNWVLCKLDYIYKANDKTKFSFYDYKFEVKNYQFSKKSDDKNLLVKNNDKILSTFGFFNKNIFFNDDKTIRNYDDSLKLLNEVELEKCFFFDRTQNGRGENLLFQVMKKYSGDLWFLVLIVLTFSFVFTMKISLLYMFIYQIYPSITIDSKPYFSYFFVFSYYIYFTNLLLIIPGLLSFTTEYHFDKCFGFYHYSKYSILLNRKLTKLNPKDNLNPNFQIDTDFINNISNNKSDLINYFYINENEFNSSIDYWNIVVFFSFFIWISKAAKIFKYHEDENNYFFNFLALGGWVYSIILNFEYYFNSWKVIFLIISYDSSNINSFYILFNILIIGIYVILNLLILFISIKNLLYEKYINKKIKEFANQTEIPNIENKEKSLENDDLLEVRTEKNSCIDKNSRESINYKLESKNPVENEFEIDKKLDINKKFTKK